MTKKIMCLDDSLTVRMLVAKTLNPHGFEVSEASDGKEGVEKALQEQIDLFIVDINMARMNGLEFVKKITTYAQYKETPIILLTTETSTQKKELGKELGVKGWIVKPFKPDSLVKIVNMLVS